MNLVNLTPHPIVIADDDGRTVLTIQPTEPPARATSRAEKAGEINGIPFVRTVFGEVTGLPELQEGTIFIVSMVVILACPERGDLVRPDTGPTCFRDGHGRIIAVRALTR